MRILVTGNQGYIGTVLTDILKKKNYEVIGYDIGFFEQCNLNKINKDFQQINKDIRDVLIEDLKNRCSYTFVRSI